MLEHDAAPPIDDRAVLGELRDIPSDGLCRDPEPAGQITGPDAPIFAHQFEDLGLPLFFAPNSDCCHAVTLIGSGGN